MPLSFSNTFKPPAQTANPFAMNSALKTKASPAPLSFSPQAVSGIKSTGTSPATPSPMKPKVTAPVVAAQPTGLTQEQFATNLKNYQVANPAPQAQPQPQPQTGNVTDRDETQVTSQAPGGLYGQLLKQGVDAYTEAGKVGQEAGLLRQAISTQKQGITGNPYYSGSVKIGQAGLVDQNRGTQLQALTDQQRALQTQGSGFLQGASQAAPVQVGYGTQYLSPLTGQSVLPQGGATGQQNPQSQASTYAQEVLTGKRSYDDAVGAMGLYGGVGKQFLDASIRAANPNYNFAQAQTLGAQQGALGPNYQFAQQALANVENALAGLGSLQTTNIPAVNSVANYVSTQTGIGSDATRSMTGAVQSLRNAYASLLASARGGTPTDYSAQAAAEIPNQPTPNDIAAIKHNMEVLGRARVQTYGNPGASSGASTGSSIYNF